MKAYKSKNGLINLVPVKSLGGAYYHSRIICPNTFVQMYSKSPIAKIRIESFCNIDIGKLIEYEHEGVDYEYNKFDTTKNKKLTNIYFLQSGNNGPIKVGTADCIKSRINQLQTGNPEEIKLICTITGASKKQESNMHKKFAKYHIRGEWFKPEILKYINI